MQRGWLCNWHGLKSWDRCSPCTSSAFRPGIHSADCPWLLDHKHNRYMRATIHPAPSSYLPLTGTLVHNANPCICYLASFPTHFADGKREASAVTRCFSSLRLAVFCSKVLLKLFRLLLLYILYIHTRARAHTHMYVFIYIYSSLSLRSWDAPGIYLCNEKREIGRTKGIFLWLGL